MSTPFLDLSKYDGREIKPNGTFVYHPIDWSLAKSSWGGAIVRASFELNQDPLYKKQIEAIKLSSAYFGSYHYFVPGNVSANTVIRQANFFCDVIENNGGYGELGVLIDAESNPSILLGTVYIARLGSILNEVTKRMLAANVNVPLGVYTRTSFIDPLWIEAGRPNWTAQYFAWLAQYSYDRAVDFETKYAAVMSGILIPPKPVSRAFPNLLAHQWTARGKPGAIPGYPPYKRSVDFNFWYADWPTVPELTDKEKLDRLWEHHPELHP